MDAQLEACNRIFNYQKKLFPAQGIVSVVVIAMIGVRVQVMRSRDLRYTCTSVIYKNKHPTRNSCDRFLFLSSFRVPWRGSPYESVGSGY